MNISVMLKKKVILWISPYAVLHIYHFKQNAFLQKSAFTYSDCPIYMLNLKDGHSWEIYSNF